MENIWTRVRIPSPPQIIFKDMKKLIIWIPIVGIIAVIVDSFSDIGWNNPEFGKIWFNDNVLLAGVNALYQAITSLLILSYLL